MFELNEVKLSFFFYNSKEAGRSRKNKTRTLWVMSADECQALPRLNLISLFVKVSSIQSHKEGHFLLHPAFLEYKNLKEEPLGKKIRPVTPLVPVLHIPGELK